MIDEDDLGTFPNPPSGGPGCADSGIGNFVITDLRVSTEPM